MPLLECVPNVSEGRDLAVLDRLTATLEAMPGVRLLDRHADAVHHRAVFTLTGEPGPLRAAVVALVEAALPLVDLTRHRGAHPRIGAVDVVPFIPLTGATMADAVLAARTTAMDVAAQFGIPVFLYEAAATRADRRALQEVRRGQFEGLAEKLRTPEWQPDFGPPGPHPTAGAIAIGARHLLVAYNINLATDRVEVARQIASTIRESSGGMPGVKAMGLALRDRGLVQVSMNLTDLDRTSMAEVFEAVTREAMRHGVEVSDSEVVGLVPAQALVGAAARYLRAQFTPRHVLDTRLLS